MEMDPNFSSLHTLCFIFFQDNSIQNISCQNVEALESLDVRNNQLTSIHGLDGCSHLRSLHLDGNKITRLGSDMFNARFTPFFYFFHVNIFIYFIPVRIISVQQSRSSFVTK